VGRGEALPPHILAFLNASGGHGMRSCAVEERLVDGAVGAQGQAFVGEGFGHLDHAGADGGLGHGPVDDVALGVAAAEAVGDEPGVVQEVGGRGVVAVPEGGEAFDQGPAGAPGPALVPLATFAFRRRSNSGREDVA
jgi:hypothetical protein